MATAKLTDNLVRRILDEGVTRDTSYFDVELPRFFLRVRPSPRRGMTASYFVRFTDGAGRETRTRIGSPDTLSVTHARKAARHSLGLADTGRNPLAEKQASRNQASLREIVTAYRMSPAWTRKASQTRRSDDIRIEKHILYRLGSRSVPELLPPVIRTFVDEVRSDKRIGARKKRLGGDGCARKCSRLLSAIVTWAVEQGHAAEHPFRGTVRLEGDGVREAVITDPSDFLKILKAMKELVEAGELSQVGEALVTVLMTTGMRRGEARDLKWGQVDLESRSIILHEPKGAKLSKRKSGVETVHLPDIAVDSLRGIKSSNAQDDDPVFRPARGRAMETTRLWSRIRTRAELRADLTLHCLRHSVGTFAALQGLGLVEIKAILRHRQTSTTERYIKAAQMAQVRHIDSVAKAMFNAKHGAAGKAKP